jgi:hypothetical protein
MRGCVAWLAFSCVAAAASAACGNAPPATTPSQPNVTIFNLLRPPLVVSAPGVDEVAVPCGGQQQIHPQGPLPWRLTVHNGMPEVTRTLTVTTNAALVEAERDVHGKPIVWVVEPPHGGAHPICPSD